MTRQDSKSNWSGFWGEGQNWIKELNEVLAEHTEAIENFSTEQAAAREKFKSHLVASFLENEKYKECESKKNSADKYIRIYSKIVAGIECRNVAIMAQLKSVAAGKESLNQYIKTLLGREDVNIELTQDDKSSSLGPLPASLRTKSEYICLFELIYEFYKSGCSLQDEKYVLIPNALRRFFELYTLIKLPGATSEVEHRLNKLMDGPHQLKVLHHFSHMTSFEKLTKHDELILLLPDAIKEFFELLQKDDLHYQSLLEAINTKAEGVS